MHHDGKCYLWIPSMVSLSSLSAEAVALINAVHTVIGKPLVTEAGQNPYVMALNDLDMGGAPFTRDAEVRNGLSMAVCGPIENLSYLPLPYVQLLVAFYGDVEALPVWFELDDLTDEVPASFPNRTYTTGPIDNPIEHVHTWATWGVFGASHAPIQYGDKWYRSTCVGESGQMLDASQYINSGLTIKTKAEYLAIVAENSPQLP